MLLRAAKKLAMVCAVTGAAISMACAQIDPNTQLRDLGLPPAVTPNLPPAQNPNLPPPSGKRYLPGAGGPFANPDRAAQKTLVPQSLSTSGTWIRGVISSAKLAQAQSAPAPRELNRINEIVPYLRRCWVVPRDIEGRKIDATVRMSLSREGRVIGVPRITYVNRQATQEQRDILLKSMAAAIKACEPFPLSASLGAAVAGRIFAIRFVVEPVSTNI